MDFIKFKMWETYAVSNLLLYFVNIPWVFSLISEMQESAALDSNPAVRLVNFLLTHLEDLFHKRLY